MTTQRDALHAQIQFHRDQGLGAQADALLPQLDEVNAKLRDAIEQAIAFYAALDPDNNKLGMTAAQIDATISRLEVARDASQQWISIMGVSGQQIAQMIQQQVIFSAISGLFHMDGGISPGAAGAGAGRALSNFRLPPVITGEFHGGGVAGVSGGRRRLAHPDWFENAKRFNQGGLPGLRPNEIAAVLEKGEEVLTADNPRHIANAGGGGDRVNLKVINAVDSTEVLEKALGAPRVNASSSIISGQTPPPSAGLSGYDGIAVGVGG